MFRCHRDGGELPRRYAPSFAAIRSKLARSPQRTVLFRRKRNYGIVF